MKYTFQIMISGTVEAAETDPGAAAVAAARVAQLAQQLPHVAGADLTLTLDTITSGIKAVPADPYSQLNTQPNISPVK